MPRLGTNLISIITVIGHRSREHVRTCCNRKLITAYPARTTPQLSALFPDEKSVNDSRGDPRFSADNIIETNLIGSVSRHETIYEVIRLRTITSYQDS